MCLRRNGGGGFSLVEIVVALGIFSFCVLTIVGLMSVALDSSKESLRDSATISILRDIDTWLRQETAKAPTAPPGPPEYFYFDEVGKPTKSGNAYVKTDDTRYKVQVVQITAATVASNIPDLADSANAMDNAGAVQKPLYLWSVAISPAKTQPGSDGERIEKKTFLLGNAPY